jgi:hypothetical protein
MELPTMSRANADVGSGQPFRNPWPPLALGLAGSALAALWFLVWRRPAAPLVFVGLLATGGAVAIRPKSAVLALAALSGLFAWIGLSNDPTVGGMDWDSARLLVIVLTGIAALAAVLVSLPQVVRRIAVSLIILFHFGGMICQATSISPCPWLSLLLQAYVYRPYVEFLYLTNAYHFYAPEPGPGSMIWFYVRFEDGQGTWYKMPLREDYPTAMEYTRRLSFCEGINQTIPPGLIPDRVINNRRIAGANEQIPMHPMVPVPQQYRKPYPLSKQNLESYARYIARTVKHPDAPEQKVATVKIYRVQHNILHPRELEAGIKPDSRATYYPFFQGEFTPDGKLINPDDPFLYWLIPIVTAPGPDPRFSTHGIGRQRRQENEPEFVIDYLEHHARLVSPNRRQPPADAIPGAAQEGPEQPEKGH